MALLLFGGVFATTMSFGTVRDAAASSVTDEQIHSFITYYRGAGAICILLAALVAFLAVKARNGDKRFRRAGVALAVVASALLVVSAWLLPLPLPALLATLFLVAGAVLMTRPPASAWFDAADRSGAKG